MSLTPCRKHAHSANDSAVGDDDVDGDRNVSKCLLHPYLALIYAVVCFLSLRIHKAFSFFGSLEFRGQQEMRNGAVNHIDTTHSVIATRSAKEPRSVTPVVSHLSCLMGGWGGWWQAGGRCRN